MKIITFIVSFLFLIQSTQGQGCGHRLIKKAKKYESKGNFSKAEKKLRKCIYKNRVGNRNCSNCYTAYADFLYTRGRLKEALNIVDEWLIAYSPKSSLRCLKFDILNTLLESNISKKNYKEALITVAHLENMNYKSSEDEYCKTKHRDWFNDKNEALYYKSNAFWSTYYTYKKIELFLNVNLESAKSKDTSAIKWALNNLISLDLKPIGAEGEKIKAQALTSLYEVYFAQKDYLTARTFAKTLEIKSHEKGINVQRVCKCDSILADLAYKNKDYALAIDYWDHYKLNCKSIDENFYNSLCIKQAKELYRKSYTINQYLTVLESVNQIDCSKYSCYEVKQLRRDVYIEIANIYEKKSQYSDAISYLDALNLEFPNDSKIKQSRRSIYIKIAKQFEEKRQYKEALYYLDVLLLDSPNDYEINRLKSDILFEFGKQLKAQGDLEKAVAFLSQIENDDVYVTQATFIIGKIYEEALRIDLAERYMNKIVSFKQTNSVYHDSANFNLLRYSVIKNDLTSAKRRMADFCDKDFEFQRRGALNDNAFYNLQNDPEFKYWLSGNRRIVVSDFNLQTNYNQDKETEQSFSRVPEYYLFIKNSAGYKQETTYHEKLAPSQSKPVYNLNWNGNFFTKTCYSWMNEEYLEYLDILIMESDENGTQRTSDIKEDDDEIASFRYYIYWKCKNDVKFETESNYIDPNDTIRKFKLSFWVKDDYTLSEQIVSFSLKPSILQIILKRLDCILGVILKPYPFLLYTVGKKLIEKGNLSESSVKKSLFDYGLAKGLPPKARKFISEKDFVTCFFDLVTDLKNNGWNGKLF